MILREILKEILTELVLKEIWNEKIETKCNFVHKVFHEVRLLTHQF